jgi:hypothetical protein
MTLSRFENSTNPSREPTSGSPNIIVFRRERRAKSEPPDVGSYFIKGSYRVGLPGRQKNAENAGVTAIQTLGGASWLGHGESAWRAGFGVPALAGETLAVAWRSDGSKRWPAKAGLQTEYKRSSPTV